MINEFKGKYFFLSNFYSAPVMYEGLLYQNNEAAFQSAKVLDIERRKQFCNIDPSTSKRKGRNVTLRHDWRRLRIKLWKIVLEINLSLIFSQSCLRVTFLPFLLDVEGSILQNY